MNTTFTFLYTDCTGGSDGEYDPSDPNSPNPGNGGTIILVPSGGNPSNPSIEPPQEERESAIDDVSWQVSKSPKNVPFWEVRSNEKFTGFKVAANKWHNRISTIIHDSSMILNGSSTTAVWTQVAATPWVSKDSVIAKMTISGTVVYPPSAPYPYFIINKRPYIFAASELFQ